jgi:hypothetical protein
MGRLIDDMLKLSRVSRGPVRRQRVDLSALARQVLDELQRNDPERQLETQIEEGLVVFGDAGLLRILLDNLLGNAWKFTRPTPQPLIRFGCRTEKNAGSSSSPTTAPASTPPTPASCSRNSSVCTRKANSKAPASASPPSNGWSAATTARCGRKAPSAPVRRSTSPCRSGKPKGK